MEKFFGKIFCVGIFIYLFILLGGGSMTKMFMYCDVSHECSMTISSSPVGQNSIQVYVFVIVHS